MNQLTEQEREDIAYKIDAEGFNYYFTSYGPDEKLVALVGPQIDAYKAAQKNLEEALRAVGVEVDL